jgi:predicted DCC family thiol-disulfide oxidoreductase YuxK
LRALRILCVLCVTINRTLKLIEEILTQRTQRVIPKMDDHIILFDGVCNYCNAMVNFIIKKDKKKLFRFAALQSPAGQNLLEKYYLEKDSFDSFIFISKGNVYQKSTAALMISQYLPWYLKLTQLFWIFPKFIRDWGYDLVAKNRYKWFGKRNECMIPSADVQSRFLS